MNFAVEISIELKKGVEDPEGMSTKKALNLLGFRNIKSVRAIKVFEIELAGANRDAVKRQAESMCEKLLANPVIHKYSIKVR